MNVDTVIVVPYNEAWPALFFEEWTRLGRALGPLARRIEHVGSSAVPGLAAKPIIDIMVGVRFAGDANRCIGPLERLSNEWSGEAGIPGRLFFRKGDPRTYHLHVTPLESEFWECHLVFRDYPRTNPETAREYGRLKYDLAGRFREDRAAYTGEKTAFVAEVLGRAMKEQRH